MENQSLDTALRNVLLTFGLDVERSVYQGTKERYLTFNYRTLPADFSDDCPERERYLIQVHLYAPLKDNINKLVREIKLALFSAGFLYPETIPADDKNGRHVVLETEATAEIDYGEV